MNKRRLWLKWSLMTLMVRASSTSAQESFSGKSITLKFSSIDLRQLLQMLADMQGLNLMMSDKVSGKTSINMRNASWQTTFDSVLASKSLGSRFDKDVLWVAPYEELALFHQRQKDREQQHQMGQVGELRQIMIEARIVEAERRFAQNLGAKLAYQQQPNLKTGHHLGASGLNGFEPGTAAITL